MTIDDLRWILRAQIQFTLWFTVQRHRSAGWIFHLSRSNFDSLLIVAASAFADGLPLLRHHVTNRYQI